MWRISSYLLFSLCRQKKTTFLIQASMRYMWLIVLVPFIHRRCNHCCVLTPLLPYYLYNQVLGRVGPFPLILLPQFGGYWIEGTNHEPKEPPETDKPPCPSSHFKLETNSTAKIYRKHFIGKVRRDGNNLVEVLDSCLLNYSFVWFYLCGGLGWIYYSTYFIFWWSQILALMDAVSINMQK